MIRSPVITILGHVDHGKTSLLDYIRHTKLVDREAGGITQRIGGYEIPVTHTGYKTDRITFIDTPGHEAFSLLRSRGANVADLAILIIDARDSLMPQTVESIAHIKAAQIPFIVAINKIDLPDVNPEKIKNDLLKYEVMVEDKGGHVPVALISAKTGKGVDELIETILLMCEDMKLTYNEASPAKAYVIETKKDKRGIVATCIIKDGVLKTGDTVYVMDKSHKVRALINDEGVQIPEVRPSTPFELLGLSELPDVGSYLTSAADLTQKEEVTATSKPILTAKDLFTPKPEEKKKLTLVVKADSTGSLEAIIASLKKNENIEVILNAVGDIYKSDVFLAKTTKAIVIGFSTNTSPEVVELAKQEKVIIKTYNIIYDLLDELNEVSDLMAEKEAKEKNLKGEAKIMATFTIEGEKIYGIKVSKGKFNLADPIEVTRGGVSIGKSKIVSLKQRAKSVLEVKKPDEGGMIFGPPLDIRVGDVIQCIL